MFRITRIQQVGALVFMLFNVIDARAGQQDPMNFRVFWPCSGNASFCNPRILAEGVIERDSVKKLARLLAVKNPDEYLSDAPDICFNSPGGNLLGGIELGRFIRKRGMSTCLDNSYSMVRPGDVTESDVIATNVVCASSCSIAFLGGRNRLFEDKIRFGVHQFSGVKGNVGDGATQETVVMLAGYIESMGVSRALLDKASVVTPDRIAWLTPNELTEFGIDNMHSKIVNWQLQALDNGVIAATAQRQGIGNQADVVLTVLKQLGQPLLLITMYPKPYFRTTPSDILDALKGQNFKVMVDKQTMLSVDNAVWISAPRSAYTVIKLPPKFKQALSNGTQLNVIVDMPRSAAVFDPSMTAPLEKSRAIFAAVLK